MRVSPLEAVVYLLGFQLIEPIFYNSIPLFVIPAKAGIQIYLDLQNAK